MPQVRIGILAYDWSRIEPWVHRLVSRIQSHENLDVVGLIQAEQKPECERAHWLYKAVNSVERKILGRPIPAGETHLRDFLSEQKAISQSDKEALTGLNLDVIINVDGALNAQDISECSKHGVWFLDMNRQHDGVAGYRAVRRQSSTATIGLSRVVEGTPDSEHMSAAWVNPKFALSRNALFMKENAVVLIMRELSRLASTGNTSVSADENIPTSQAPGLGGTLAYCGHLLGEIIGRGLLGLRRKTGLGADTYFLLKGEGDALTFDPTQADVFFPEGNNFWADPFLWEKDGVIYCFYEHYSRATKLGHIAVGRFDDSGFTVLGDVLKPGTHLSFPFLFEHDGELFMMPETCATKCIEVWRCTDFPLQWELHSTAFEGTVAADSMVIQHKGKWWLFTNLATDAYRDNCSELHVFEIDGPDLKSIKPHHANPVVFDSETARNGGRIHVVDGRLFRPSQINAYGQYGYGLNIMEIEELSLDSYRETRVRRIDPNFKDNLSGCHHFDAQGGHFVMDSLLAPGAKASDIIN